MGACCGDDKEYQTATKFYCYTCLVECFGRPKRPVEKLSLTKKYRIPGRRRTCNVSCQYMILISNWVEKETPIEATWRRAVQRLDSCLHDNDELWRMAIAKIEGVLSEEIRTIKKTHQNPLSLTGIEKQEQWLAQLNTKLCCHCLIPCDFEYCDNCDLIYNPLPCIIYTIPKEEEPISNCALELESPFDPDSNSDNDNNENNGSSSIQNGNNNDNNINSDSNSNSNYEQYIVLSDLTKKQELK
ncbi:hypothetical protein G9A89_006624 [Geosiphon pyriformis]|nr:hypothetical protein G9A89_006624 [Geosiphon pyriformis]